MPQAVVGVDMGTQATKAQVVHLDGNPLATADVTTSLVCPRSGAVEQDPAELERSVTSAIRDAVAQSPTGTEILAIGIDGQMGGAIGVDATFTPVTPYESWLDTQAEQHRSDALQRQGAAMLRAGGIIPFVGPRAARWLGAQPRVRQHMAKVLAPTGYIVGRLTGADAADLATCDRTQAHLYGCFDVAARRWSPELAAGLEIPVELLPRVVEPTEVVGTLSAEAADACGLQAGVPVAGGLGDGTAGWVAAGAFTPGTCIDTGGSSEHFAITIDRFTTDPYPETLLTCMPSAMTGRFHLFGFTAGTGLTRRWWTELVAEGEYDALERQAAELAPGAGGVLAIPHLYGMLTPYDPQVRGAFVGFDGATSAAHMYRALFEAIAFEFAEWIERVGTLAPGTPPPEIGVAIGGAAQSPLAGQVKADVLGIPYVRMQPHVSAARGTALVAAVAVGACRLDETAWQSPSRDVLARHTPNEDNTTIYRARAPVYKQLREALTPVYRALGELAEHTSSRVTRTEGTSQ